MAKQNQKIQPAKAKPKRASGAAQPSILLALTLVPLMIGVLMILGWGLDINIWDPPELQVWIGILFILLSFAASNAFQKKWYPAAGWLLLGVADFMLFRWIALWVQILAFVMVAAGLVLISIEFYYRWRANSQAKKK